MAQAGYTPVSLYYSNTTTNVPLAANLVNGELAINIRDGKLFYKDSLGVVQLIASKSGASGDVVGPASSTDNAIVRFDGITGKLVQDSVVTIADTTGDIVTPGNLTLNAQGDVRFADADSSNWVAFQAPAVVASNVTWTLPAADGLNNQVLITNGAGTLSWATNYGGDVFGPGSSTDNSLVAFDGVTGKLIKQITTGTGVVTALGVNTGSAGAFVVNGGALGTPSSGTVTNLTGTASININGTVGATTQNTGYFTVLRLYGSGSGYVGLQGAAAAGSTTYTLPSTDGSNGQVLTTSGTGTLSWSTAATSVTITNDTSTATDVYPAFMGATSGTASTIYTGNAKLLFKPSTGEFKALAPIAANGVVLNNTTVSTSYTIDTGTNGMSVGPITVNSGITMTVASGQRWLVF